MGQTRCGDGWIRVGDGGLRAVVSVEMSAIGSIYFLQRRGEAKGKEG